MEDNIFPGSYENYDYELLIVLYRRLKHYFFAPI
jgi:hypothetical protein